MQKRSSMYRIPRKRGVIFPSNIVSHHFGYKSLRCNGLHPIIISNISGRPSRWRFCITEPHDRVHVLLSGNLCRASLAILLFSSAGEDNLAVSAFIQFVRLRHHAAVLTLKVRLTMKLKVLIPEVSEVCHSHNDLPRFHKQDAHIRVIYTTRELNQTGSIKVVVHEALALN